MRLFLKKEENSWNAKPILLDNIRFIIEHDVFNILIIIWVLIVRCVELRREILISDQETSTSITLSILISNEIHSPLQLSLLGDLHLVLMGIKPSLIGD